MCSNQSLCTGRGFTKNDLLHINLSSCYSRLRLLRGSMANLTDILVLPVLVDFLGWLPLLRFLPAQRSLATPAVLDKLLQLLRQLGAPVKHHTALSAGSLVKELSKASNTACCRSAFKETPPSKWLCAICKAPCGSDGQPCVASAGVWRARQQAPRHRDKPEALDHRATDGGRDSCMDGVL